MAPRTPLEFRARSAMMRTLREELMHIRLCVLALLAGLVSCHAPRRDYNVEQIANVKSLKELMRVQSTVADPRFKLARKLQGKSIDDAQFAEFVDMGNRLQATAKRMSAFSKGPGFDKYVNDMAKQAAALEAAARGHDGSTTTSTALAIKNTCAACHGEFRR